MSHSLSCCIVLPVFIVFSSISCHLYHFFLSVIFLNIPQLCSQKFFLYHYWILWLLVLSFVPFLPLCHFFNHPLSLSMSFLYHSNRPLIVHTFFILNIVVYTAVGWLPTHHVGGVIQGLALATTTNGIDSEAVLYFSAWEDKFDFEVVQISTCCSGGFTFSRSGFHACRNNHQFSFI